MAPRLSLVVPDVARSGMVRHCAFHGLGRAWGILGEPIRTMQKPMSSKDSMTHYVHPVGFELKLFADETLLGGKPLAMNWDERGRLWLVLTRDYPNEMQPKGKGHDRIVIVEDTNGDGVGDNISTFADVLSIPTSLAFANGGVIVTQAPDMLFLKDTDGDGKADVRKVLFTGFGTNDTHAGPSNLTYGPDNWIYAMIGYAGFAPMPQVFFDDPEAFGKVAAGWLEAKILEIGPENVAAFVAEPIQGAGGVIIPPATYWPEIARILKGRDILLVADEVITGFGRTGNWFGSETFGIEPDLMPIAKGLSSGYLPIGGVMVADKVADVIIGSGDFNHGFTYSAHPVAAAAALENLRIIEDERLVDRVRDDIGPYLQSRWRALADHPLVGEARMTGLMGALELVPNKPSRKESFPDTGKVGTIARDFSFRNGLVMRAVRDSLIIAPPLTLTHDEADILAATARKTLDDTLAEVKRLGLVA